ncbi:MAG: Rab family GTPase [Candidatus Hodarchaeota archaeon]
MRIYYYNKFKVCLFADKNVGKKTLAKKFLQESGTKMDTSVIIGITNYTKDIEFHERTFNLEIWSWRMEEQFKKHLPSYLDGTNGVILMYDIANAESLTKLAEWSKLIKETILNPSILLVGNKCDLEENREIPKKDIEKFIEEFDVFSSIEISTKTGENVEKMFNELMKVITQAPYRIKSSETNYIRSLERSLRDLILELNIRDREIARLRKLLQKHDITTPEPTFRLI